MPLKQITQNDLQYANITPGPWFAGTESREGLERQLLTNASGDRAISATTHPKDHHPDLSSRGGELSLAASAPELLVSLVNVMACLAPAQSDFHEIEWKAFDEAFAAVNKVGAGSLLKAPMKLIAQDSLSDIDIKPGPWFVATGCSWRRILTEPFDDQVLLPAFPDKGIQKLDCRAEELRLISVAPELLVSLINLLSVWMPYAVDFNEDEQAVFDAAIEVVKKSGAGRLLDRTLAD